MEPSNNTDTEDETMALRRKRPRRVSFADNEITSVHVFHRDESSSSDTSPSSAKTALTPEVRQFFEDLGSDGYVDDLDLKESSSPLSRYDADVADGGSSFLRSAGSPSPGGSSAAASPDDEYDFHGPVSASFIRPERLSDSGASDDLTMDSTAFSLHYRSLARSDSGDMKTPTRFRLQFEEKTPSQTSSPPAATGSFMVLTEAKKLCSAAAASDCRDSNDMSIVGENPQMYDYDRLPPALDAILAEGSKDLPAISLLNSETVDSPNINGSVMPQGSIDSALGSAGSSGKHNISDKEELNYSSSISSPDDQFTHDLLYNRGDNTVADASVPQIKIPDTSIKEIKESIKDATVLVHEQLDFLNANRGRTPLKMGEGNELNVSAQSELGYSVGEVKDNNPDDNEKGCIYKDVETLNASLKEQLFSLTSENNMHQGLINTDDHQIDSFRNITMLSQNDETFDTKKGEENFNLFSVDISYNDNNSKPVEITASPLQMSDFNLVDSTVGNRGDAIVSVTYDKPFSSPVNLLDQKSSPHVEFQRNCCGEVKQLDEHSESIFNGLGQDVECITGATANEVGLSGFKNSRKPSSHFEVAQVNKFAKGASKRKPAKSPAKTTPLTSLHEPSSELLQSNMQDLSHKGISDGHYPPDNNYRLVLQVALSPLTKSSSGKIRKGVEILSDVINKEEVRWIDRSPEVHKIVNSNQQLVLEQTSYMRSQREKLGYQTWNDWADMLKKFFEGTQHLLSPSVDKLNLQSICMLEDVLVHQQKVKQCTILCYDIHSQWKIADHLNISRHKRAVEARMLLLSMSYKKAKLQLLHLKHDRLLKKVQQLSAGLQESQMMKMNFTSSSKSGAIGTQANDCHILTSLRNSEGKCQVSCTKVTKMRQELEHLVWKQKSLSEFFHSYCKMEGDLSHANIIESVRDHLQKRTRDKFIFQSLKLWDIQNFEHKDGCYGIILNYCGYITQRVIVNACLPSIIISNSLNDVNIGKTFPDMGAFSAFEFVLNPHTTKKCTGSRCLGQETQITSSLLSNLLDVLEEVQLSQNQIRNLVQAKFFSHSVQQLDLQLYFLDFCNGRKVKVTLDMTCIKCGAYPVKVLPSQICGPASGEQSMPSTLVSEIRNAAESVRGGYSRIIRLCRCISQILQAHSKQITDNFCLSA